jgi:hypothetical protein
VKEVQDQFKPDSEELADEERFIELRGKLLECFDRVYRFETDKAIYEDDHNKITVYRIANQGLIRVDTKWKN